MSHDAIHHLGLDTAQPPTEYEREAYRRGADAARNAAEWVADGNSDPAAVFRLLTHLENCDPAAWDALPAPPNLSGEQMGGGDGTPLSLAREIIGDSFHFGTETIEAIAGAFEEGVSDTFGLACERELREWLGVPEDRPFDEWRRDECAACELWREDHPYASCPEFQEPAPELGDFTLTITTGNAAMRTREDVATVLHDLYVKVCESDSGIIRDENGNTCGSWRFE